VFLNDLVSLEEFDLEVRRQRRRLQFLLGCDRALRDLAETNDEIFAAPLDELRLISRSFFATCDAIRDDLAPLFEARSPYPNLDQELATARDQLRVLDRDVFTPLKQLRSSVESFDSPLTTLAKDLTGLLAACSEIIHFELPPDTRPGEPPVPVRLPPILALNSRLLRLKGSLHAVAFDRFAELNTRFGDELPRDAEEEKQQLCDHLEELGERLLSESARVLDLTLKTLQSAEIANVPLDLEELRDHMRTLAAWLRDLGRDNLEPTLRAIEKLRQKNSMALRERICQELGFIRTTFLQPCFAHIAADDPRSVHSPQYFYFKEFAEEANRSSQLLEEIAALWRYIESLQNTHLQGLRFTPSNLNKIANRLLSENRTVPSGPGWKELEGFLAGLKNHVVPRLQMACSLPGIRFDDKDQLAAFADRLTEASGTLLAKRESAYKLIKEVDRLAQEDGQDHLHDRYRSVILRVTCQEMAAKLRTISLTLLELIPYVGAMVGGIRMRTTLTFSERDPAL
jgi:hypothetical protein